MKRTRQFTIVCLILTILALAATPVVFAAPPSQEGAVHVVSPGETLSAIAQRYGVSQQAIMQANSITNPSLIVSGQRLVIPGASAPVSSEGPAAGTAHVVAPGETLSAIAARYGISLAALTESNGIANPSLIAAGTTLVIPAAGAAPQAPAAPSNAAYVVSPGDTLASIAVRHNSTVAAIAAANGINNPRLIRPGQRLTIPANSAPPAAQPAPQSGLSVLVSVSQQRCWVYQGEALMYDWPCSTGRPGSGTKTGTFYVQSKIREAWGSRWGFYMPYWLGIYWAGGSENGIHGLPYEPGGYPIWANSVGTPVTFGCVLLGAWESKTLWDMAYIGMPVTIQP